MKNLSRPLLATTLALSLVAPLLPNAAFAQQAAQLQPLDRIVAVVDEDVIMQSELDRAVAMIKSQYANQPGQLPPEAVLRKQVLERLVLMKLQVARAKDTGIGVSNDELNGAMASVAQQNGTTPDGLRAKLAAQGMNFDDFRSSIRDEIIVQRLRQNFAQSRVQVSDAEVDAALTAKSSGGLQYHLAQILVGLPDGATTEQIATGQKKIDGIKDLIDKNQMDFNAAAVRYSDAQNALEGGDLGWRSQDEIPSAFVSTLQNLKPGQVVGPLRGPNGFQLIKLVETRNAAQAGAQKATEYDARHILIRVADAKDAAKAKAKIDTLRARIVGGADFAEVAKESSEDLNSAPKGGELGWFTADAFGDDFGKAVAALKDGETSQPFRSEAGWHIVQREGSRQTDVTDRNQRAQIRETIGRRKLEDQYDRFLQEMRGEAYVNIRDEQQASAAAPAATTPAPAKTGTP